MDGTLMADQDPWEEAAKQFKPAAQASPTAKTSTPNDDWKMWAPHPDVPPPTSSGGALQYAKDTISNIPSSAGKLLGNVGSALAHPGDTLRAIGSIPVGLAEKAGVPMPKPGPGETDAAQNLDAMWDAVKKRYGSPHAIAESIRTDPVGVAADISAVAGGIGGLAKGGAAVADAANLGRVASGASKLADVAGTVSDVTNPMNAVTKPIGAIAKATGKGVVRSALPGLGGKAERYGASPATSVLENTSGLTPEAVKQSALAHISNLKQKLDTLTQQAAAAGNEMDLAPARKVILNEMQTVAKNNGLTDDLKPMLDQLTKAKPGFAGSQSITGDINPMQPPDVGLGMKRQFGKDFTKFDAAVPMRSEARNLGNKAYHQLSTEFNKAVPGAEPVNQALQSASPIPDAAQRAQELASPTQNAINRVTRPTGGLIPTMIGGAAGGPIGAAAVLGAQEALSSPTVKMGIAREAYGAGKAIGSPITSRTLNAVGVEQANDTVAKQLSDAILGGQQ
jgi:hypothetical protein